MVLSYFDLLVGKVRDIQIHLVTLCIGKQQLAVQKQDFNSSKLLYQPQQNSGEPAFNKKSQFCTKLVYLGQAMKLPMVQSFHSISENFMRQPKKKWKIDPVFFCFFTPTYMPLLLESLKVQRLSRNLVKWVHFKVEYSTLKMLPRC